jgi:hypothetical protein
MEQSARIPPRAELVVSPPAETAALGRMYTRRGFIWLFVSYFALNLLGDLWRHRLHAVFLSGVLRRFLHQLVFALGPSDIIAAGHHVTATKHFGHD